MKTLLLTVLATSLALAASGARAQSFANFESGHVRPLALAPGGGLLFAVNTPDNRLAIYTPTAAGLALVAEVPVGLEPVAVAVRETAAGPLEAWVVNHLSDSVSIVAADPAEPAAARVVRTLLVGDEPRDVVFAGSGGDRAFVSAAHRGQNRPGDPQLTTEGVGRADVWVFDADALGAPLGGTPLAVVALFGDSPRALAASPDGSLVYAAVFLSGNRTTTVAQPLVSSGGGLPPQPPGHTADPPAVGLIVKHDGGAWRDEIGRDWSASVPFSLPDLDVFAIDADASPPAAVPGGAVAGVGSVLFNMGVRPSNGKLYVTNTEARNEIRFETGIVGHNAESRITIVDGAVATPRHLNPHIDYGIATGPPAEIELSLAQPTDLVFSADGSKVFVAGLGSGKVGVFDAEALEAGTITKELVEVGLGPSGLALDETRDRLYVMNLLDHSISVVVGASQPTRAELARVALAYHPMSASLRAGRRFLYDAQTTSGHGDNSCALCHVFGDFDGIAWDLGNPFGVVLPNPNHKRPLDNGSNPLHPMKGPMTTQTLRGLDGAGPMHWRADKTGGLHPDGTVNPDGDTLDEVAAFNLFNAAFTGLQGRASELDAADMQALTDYMLTVRLPPNPIKALDDSDLPAEVAGRNIFMNGDTILTQAGCDDCHHLPLATSGLIAQTGQVAGPQNQFKIPHMRNQYQKIGMFGAAAGAVAGLPAQIVGAQVRGFGFSHDGSISTVFDFLKHPQTSLSQFPNANGANPDEKRRNLEAYLLRFDTGLRPIVGQQATLAAATLGDLALAGRLDLLIARADAGDCELVVKGRVDGTPRGFLYTGADSFVSDQAADPPRSAADLAALAGAAGQELTFTCVPPGSGDRIALDRDEDGVRDGDDGCPAAADPGQEDVDGDGVGNACDTACANGADDDGDGLADWPADPGCRDFAGALEDPACDDDADNDGDGAIDWDGGTALATPDPQCADQPYRNSEQASSASCGLLGPEIALAALALRGRFQRRSRRA